MATVAEASPSRGQPGRSAPAFRQGAQGSQRGYPVAPRHVPARSPRRTAARRQGRRGAGRDARVQPACRADRVPDGSDPLGRHLPLHRPGTGRGRHRRSDVCGRTPVYSQRSLRVLPSPSAVRDAMPAFFELLREEPQPSVRAVLGHFLFVHVRPYPDGNGRMGRLRMNVTLATGGYPWTVLPVKRRDDCMVVPEDASARGGLGPFTGFPDPARAAPANGGPRSRFPTGLGSAERRDCRRAGQDVFSRRDSIPNVRSSFLDRKILTVLDRYLRY